MRRFRRILHATDFSTASAPAFAEALALARQERAELRLVHVMTPPALFLEDSYLSARTFREMQSRARRAVEDRLARLRARARRAGVRAGADVREGLPADEIVRAARRRRADLIVVGTHGRSGFARAVLGSVAARVVTLARCPVLTVRGR
ncbi:MAG: universal stress protein [Candidatus Rokubacteria bacterium]|nr:universal stress protein [Candidatus Rokubacteria bacterium]